ncbi:MAG TPA: ABC transporter ATP-binding protein [Vicinamibacteria bacterium]|nr:ABC transporter ATP-binding protein [Vicinamibacteria bacterium]
MTNTTHRVGSPKLVATNLRMSYGGRQALFGLSFSLDAGRILGFLGPNGAGKTTAIRILTTILKPTSGRFSVDGISSDFPQRIRSKIGVLPESLGFHKQMTGLECVSYFGQLYGRSAADAHEHGLALLEEVGLGKRARSLIGTYSRGMRQRLGIARALVNDPVIVFLDEPTLGLDPRGQQELLVMVRRIAKERNAGIILCTHHLSEIEGYCDDVVILNAGRVVTSGSVAEVIGRAQRELSLRQIVKIHVPTAATAQAAKALDSLSNVLKVVPSTETEGWLRVELDRSVDGDSSGTRVKNAILDALIRAEIPILNFEVEGGRLLDVFFHLTENEDEQTSKNT